MAGAAPQPHTKSGKKALDAEINLVPFIDLLSCCISFLLITAVWTQIAGLQVASRPGAAVEIPKVTSTGGGAAFDRRSLAQKLKTLKASLPDQSAITVQPEDAVAYDDLVSTVDICLGEQLRNVTVAPLN
jgi:biopolymer transport protein ExbD